MKTLIAIAALFGVAACAGDRPDCNSYCIEQSTLPEIIYFDDTGKEISREPRIGGWSTLK